MGAHPIGNATFLTTEDGVAFCIKMSSCGDISGAKEFSAIKQTRWIPATMTSRWNGIGFDGQIYCGLPTSLVSHWNLPTNERGVATSDANHGGVACFCFGRFPAGCGRHVWNEQSDGVPNSPQGC